MKSCRHCAGGLLTLLALTLLSGAAISQEEKKAEKPMTKDCFVASYYFGNYHVDPRNEKLKGKGWTEWELVKAAKPRFEGHHQPNVPLWGYLDEADPKDMAKKIDAAADNSLDAFIFDWYYYNDGPFLQRCVEEGFMKAPNNNRLKFALMWANHDWQDIHPAHLNVTPPLLYPGTVTPETFDKMTDYIINTYFKHPSYWKIDGCPYFSIYELHTLIKGLGGVPETAKQLARFREKVKAAGFPDLHLNAVLFGIQILPNETVIKKPEELIPILGVNSVTSYVWVHHVPLNEYPCTPYAWVMDQAEKHWYETVKKYAIPYHPNVTMGWDSSPRACQTDPHAPSPYPFTATISGNTPEAFHEALQRCKTFLMTRPAKDRILTINCWNEWTEGSYLEPDTVHGMAYLEAIHDVFGR
jgi:hypothetical protein